MRRIQKKSENEPKSLKSFRKNNPTASYKDLEGDEGQEIRHEIREACTKEQFYLCAYCCKRIDGIQNDTVNEHVEAQKLAPKRTLDFTNLVASCTTQGQCDKAHGSQALPLTPLMPECEKELKFYFSGTVKGLTPRAETSIKVLGLNNTILTERRKIECESLIYQNYGCPAGDWYDEDPAVIEILIQDLEKITDGKLEPYAPVLVRILKEYLKNSQV